MKNNFFLLFFLSIFWFLPIGVGADWFDDNCRCGVVRATRAVKQSTVGGVCVFKDPRCVECPPPPPPPSFSAPFIYFNNPPGGKISVSINSKLNNYVSKPLFNQKNGWVLYSKDGKIYVYNKEEKLLDYEFVFNQIKLNRYGRNFSSKEEIINYLQNSDFFDRLGFSLAEKGDILEAVVNSIKSSKDKKFYYLNILSKSAIEELTTLNIKPKPDNLERVYFIIYPTNVPIKIFGDLSFPNKNNSFTGVYSVKEVGSVTLPLGVFVFWE